MHPHAGTAPLASSRARLRRLARPSLTLRARLTVIYGSVFLLAGLLLVLVMFLLVRQRVGGGNRVVFSSTGGDAGIGGGVEGGSLPAAPPPGPTVPPDYTTRVERAITAYDADTLRAFLQWSVVAVLVVVAVAALIGWLMAGRTLQPLTEITATARRASDRNLHQRIALQGPDDELKELADTFDAMLERLDQSFAGQRRFVANASHELRTPLAISRTVLEVAMGDPDASSDLRQVGRTLLATNERSERLIDGLLALATSEGEPSPRAPVDLADFAAQALDQAAAEAVERGVRVTSRLGPAPVSGDGVLLERLALNLVQNGVRHNAPGGFVEVVTTTLPAGWSELVVANSGPVIRPYEVDALFEPFRRLRDERIAGDRGVGLGLSIVRSVARAHGGVVAATPRDGGGLVVRVGFPAVPVEPPAEAAAPPATTAAWAT
jgi:signal transduction histidine kinase